MTDAERIAAGLTKAQRELLIASEPGGWGQAYVDTCLKAMMMYGGEVFIRQGAEGFEVIPPDRFYLNPPPTAKPVYHDGDNFDDPRVQAFIKRN
jgi:hypothetical protein